MDVISTIVGLLAAVAVLSLLARRINLPYPTVMVLAGLAVCFIPHLPQIRLDPHVVFLIFLPPLLYAAAWDMPWREFRENLRPILLLAVGFVLFTAAAVAVVMHYAIPDLPWAAAIAFGAIVSPPDAVAATAILSRLGVPNRVRVILEGESLVNDASGLTLYGIALGVASSGSISVGREVGQVAILVGGGIAIGLVMGWIATWIHRKLDDPLAETVITLLSPYAAFLPAEAVHASGVLATVVMGLYVSRKAAHLFSPRLRQSARAVWDTMTFMLNGLVFVLIGLQLRFVLAHISGESPLKLAGLVLLLTAVLVVARIAWVFPVSYLPRKLGGQSRQKPMPNWRRLFLVAYTGMRGVISLAIALSLPVTLDSGAEFPQRGLIIFLTFGVIMTTLIFQSLTLPGLVKALKLNAGDELRCEEREARLQVAGAAITRLDELSESANTPKHELNRIRDYYQAQVDGLTQAKDDDCLPPETPLRFIHRQLIDVERKKLLELYGRDVINEAVLGRIENDLDLEELRWRAGA
jgi:CPA1 family monovalent cation:H+ antiporter